MPRRVVRYGHADESQILRVVNSATSGGSDTLPPVIAALGSSRFARSRCRRWLDEDPARVFSRLWWHVRAGLAISRLLVILNSPGERDRAREPGANVIVSGVLFRLRRS